MTTPPSAAIEVRGLTKRYGRRIVVDGLDLTVPTGAVAGFVGPNGAGKTTTLRMLLGLVRPTRGDGTVLGEPLQYPVRYLRRVGALIESPALYPSLSGTRNLEALAVLGGQDPARVPALLDEVGLAGRGGDRFSTYSLGMKQRLAIAAALLADPDLLVLDEPTNGLDPVGIRQMRELVRRLAAGGPDGSRQRTVLVSSHMLAEVEQICDWLIVVEAGQLAYAGPTDNLMASDRHQVVVRPEDPAHLAMLADLGTGLGGAVARQDATLRIELPIPVNPSDNGSEAKAQAQAQVAELNRAALSCGITLVEITPVYDSLEDRYHGLVHQVTHRQVTHGQVTREQVTRGAAAAGSAAVAR